MRSASVLPTASATAGTLPGDFTKAGAGVLTLAGFEHLHGADDRGGRHAEHSDRLRHHRQQRRHAGRRADERQRRHRARPVVVDVDDKRRIHAVRRRFTRRPDVHPGGVGQRAQPGPNTPTGSVDFYDETTSTDLRTVAVDQSGNAALSIASSVLEDDQITATYTPDGGSSQLLTGASAPIEQQVVDLPTIGVDADVPLAWQGQAGDFLFSCMDGGSSTQATDVYFTLAADGVSGPG